MAQSCELRALLNGPILQDCIRDLKAQAEKVDVALAKGISDTEDCVKAMFAELEVVRSSIFSFKDVMCLWLDI